MKKPLPLLTWISVFLFASAVSCGDNAKEEKEKQYHARTKPRDVSVAGGVCLSPDEFRGMKLFMRHCNKCHPGGEEGRGPKLNNKTLPPILIKMQVRMGGGKMPKFTKDQISKENLEKIVDFLMFMRKVS
jgi:hypothetical protein